MISFDTNVLLYSLNRDCSEYHAARSFFAGLPADPGLVVVCELVLLELYVLLRNPAVLKYPLSPADAASTIRSFRENPSWALIDYPGRRHIMDEVWRLAGQPNIGRLVVFEAGLALTLRHHGVTLFATRNTSHFAGFGFSQVWDPLR